MKLAWQQIPSTVVSEILCNNKLDGVVLDTEHGCFNNETLYSCIQIISANKKKCFVRLTDVDKSMIRHCLDAGISGLIFSSIETIEHCEKVKEYCLFPSVGGKRGLGLVRENAWGEKDLSGNSLLLIAQIETKEGVLNIDKILSKDIFSHFMIGPYDLSASLGSPGDFTCKKYLDMVECVKSAATKSRMAVHIPKDISSNIKKYDGYNIIAIGMDTISILDFYKEMEVINE